MPADTPALRIRGLLKQFDTKIAVNRIDLDVPRGSFFGFVGPNGAGKTTTLSMATGLLRPDAGTVEVGGIDLWARPHEAKRLLGVMPDGLRTFDRLTGPELVTYAGLLRGMDPATVADRTGELIGTLGLAGDAGILVTDYSAGMKKKIALACAVVHAPDLLVLDEPFEAVDPVSAATIREILQAFVAGGGTVVMSSHVMDLVQRLCDHLAIITEGIVVAAGPVADIAAGEDLESRFVELVGGRVAGGGLSWLRPSSS